jgi:pimeloyl-ACP methyl ester carboxylesterase
MRKVNKQSFKMISRAILFKSIERKNPRDPQAPDRRILPKNALRGKSRFACTSHLLYLPLACLMIFAAAGCADDLPKGVKYEMLKEYSLDDLKRLTSAFLVRFLVGDMTDKIDPNAKYEGEVQLRVYKVSVTSAHPARANEKINLSGLLIVPPAEEERSYRRVVVPPSTYVEQGRAPTLQVANGSTDPDILFWLIEAFNHGYAVMILDYPGFGDSFGQCFIPYVEKESIVRTTVEYVEAALSVLRKEGYNTKGGLVISGYSLGAYVALQLAREYETNSAAYNDRPVDLVFVGGSPCKLLQEANLLRASDSMPHSFLFPLALQGYKENGYPHLVTADYLREPYASEAALHPDGLPWDFTNKTAELFTESFLKNEGQDEINRILADNSVKPWKNACTLIMFHGEDDETVYFDQARDFALEQEQYGGSVIFLKTPGTHTSIVIPFFCNYMTN